MGEYSATGSNAPTPAPAFCKIFGYVGSPISQACCEEPLECVKNLIINISADINYWVLSTPGSLAGRIFDLSSTCINATLSSEMQDAIAYVGKPVQQFIQNFTTIGGQQPDRPPVHLLDLIGPTLFLNFTAGKIKNNTIGVFRSLAMLSQGMLLGQWTHGTNLRSKKSDYNMYVETSKKYTFSGLCEDILAQTFITAAWGSLAFITQRGMRNAIARASESAIAQDAVTLLTAAIGLYQLLSLTFNNADTADRTNSRYSISDDVFPKKNKRNKDIESQDSNPYDNQDNYSLNFDYDDLDPIKLAKGYEKSKSDALTLPALDETFNIDDFGYV